MATTETNPFVAVELAALASPILTAEEVGDLLKLKVWTIQDLARRGEIPSIKIGRSRRFLRAEIEAYIVDRVAKRDR